MKAHFIKENFDYDGTQLRSLFAYLEYRILGDSIVSWIGGCDIPDEHMVDGEDLLANAEIRGGKMLHFIIEKFGIDLYSGVCFQRLFAGICKDALCNIASNGKLASSLYREGDDLYVDDRKLSISIATVSPTSTLVHFALNIINDGTPVKTLSLSDLGVDSEEFAKGIMASFVKEESEIVEATQKVKWVK